MANSVVDICNLGLVRAEVSSMITDLNQARPEANVARVVYPQSRDTLLAMAPWPFATRRATLALVDGETVDDWSFVYQLPSDCLEVRRLTPLASPFVREGQRLLTDTEEAQIIYTAAVTDVTTFHPLFADALSWLLAADFAISLGKDKALEQRAKQRFELALDRARAKAVGERKSKPAPAGEIIAVRGEGNGFLPAD